MSRQDVLVTADWAEKNLGTDGIVFVEVDEDTTAYDGGPHPRRRQDQLDDRAAGPGPPRHRRQGAVREAAVRQGHRQRRHRRALRRQQQLVRGLRVLGLQALRPRRTSSCSTAAARSGSSTGARSTPTRSRSAAAPPTPRRTPTCRSARSATRSSTRSAPRTSSTSARPTSSPARSSPRRTCRRSRRSGPATSPRRSTCRGARPPTRTAPSSRTTSCASSTSEAGPRRVAADHRLLPHRRARPATPGSCCTSCWATQDVKNYDGSWTEYGSLIGVPIELGTGRVALMCGAPDQTVALPAGTDLSKETVLVGQVARRRLAGRRRLRPAARRHRRVHRRGRRLGVGRLPVLRRTRAPGRSARCRARATARPRSPSTARACTPPSSARRLTCQPPPRPK